jgi:5-methylcytosine-specific restriction endonuclease McrA
MNLTKMRWTTEQRKKQSERMKGNGIWNGRKHTQESKDKIKKNSNPWAKGKKFSAEYRKKLSESHIGEKHHNWQGGKTSEGKKIRHGLEYRLWRESVFKRDNYKCVWCGKKGYLHADHIKPFAHYPELRFAIDNGRTLCVECHKTTDTYLWKNK